MKRRILVVDDEVNVCQMLQRFLEKKDYEVTTASSGEEAIVKTKAEKPHMVILDIMMPGMSGIEVLKKIRTFDKEVGIVMITAVNEDLIGKKCIELGAYDYITKPLSLDYLDKVVLVKLLDLLD